MNKQRTDEAALIEAQILENKQLVETIKESEQSLSKPVPVDDYIKWLDQ